MGCWNLMVLGVVCKFSYNKVKESMQWTSVEASTSGRCCIASLYSHRQALKQIAEGSPHSVSTSCLVLIKNRVLGPKALSFNSYRHKTNASPSIAYTCKLLLLLLFSQQQIQLCQLYLQLNIGRMRQMYWHPTPTIVLGI